MPRLRYSAAAKEDLKEIARYIAKDKPNAARQWVAKLREKCRLAARHPEIGDDVAISEKVFVPRTLVATSSSSAKTTEPLRSFELRAAIRNSRSARGTQRGRIAVAEGSDRKRRCTSFILPDGRAASQG
jgi:plasmid stabilization system protein ParE